MAKRVLNLRNTVMRIRTASYYIVCPFIEGTLGPIPDAAPRGTDELVLNQDKADAWGHHISVSDLDTFKPVEIPMSFLLEASHVAPYVMQAMSNPRQASPWTVAERDWTAVTISGTRKNAEGTAVTCYPPSDAVRRAGLVIVEVLSVNPDASGDDYGRALEGVYFRPPQVDVANPRGMLKTTLECYGGFTEISGFTAGTDTLEAP